MSKKERHREDLYTLLDESLKSGDDEALVEYLTSNSSLPGRRANIELAMAFAEIIEEFSAEHETEMWELCVKLSMISHHEAPVNDPREFLTFCGTQAIGAIGSIRPGLFEEVTSRLRALAEDPRWRTREAVAFGLQKLLEKEGERTLNALEGWIMDGEWLAMRAVAAGVADPTLLKNKKIAGRALDLHKEILDMIRASTDRKSDAFKTMRKGLGYTLSVVVHAIPEEGFDYLRWLAGLRDRDVAWIVRENLKKNRLRRNYPEQVDSIRRSLG